MSELLLPAKQAATRLGLSIRSFYRYRNRLIARGMQAVRAGRRIAYREASIDRLIREAAERDEPLYEASSRGEGEEVAAARTNGPRNDAAGGGNRPRNDDGGKEGGGDE